MASEKRLIDANALRVYRCINVGANLGGLRAIVLEKDIRNAPTVDAVEVVWCKDCKHWHEEIGWCDKHSHFVDSTGDFCHPFESSEWKMFDADYFCKDGERKDNG